MNKMWHALLLYQNVAGWKVGGIIFVLFGVVNAAVRVCRYLAPCTINAARSVCVC